MNIKKSLLVAGAVATVGVSVAGLGVASAATDQPLKDSIVDKIATKLNVDRGEVRAVVDENRAQPEANRQQRLETRLDELVKQGKLTENQKIKILAKLAELHDEREKDRELFQGETKDEMRAVMDQRERELKAWAAENAIPMEYMNIALGVPPSVGTAPAPKMDVEHYANPQ